MNRNKNYARENRRVVKEITKNPQWRKAIVAQCAESGRPLTPNAVHEWRNLKKGVPAERVIVVSRVTGWPPHKIRPDIFPQPDDPSL